MSKENLFAFISEEKEYFYILSKNIDWNDSHWDMSDWLRHRGNSKYIPFITDYKKTKKTPSHIILPIKDNLPNPFIDFVKALCVHTIRTKNIGYMAARNYVNECRRLHIFMSLRKEKCVTELTRWHFEETVNYLKEKEYKNISDAATNLKVVAEIIDRKRLSKKRINFKHSFKSKNNYNYYKSLKSVDVNEPIGNDKLPSYEAMVAYAKCTNNPIDKNEEILLRTIDLLIVMGQRGNEITHIPLNCWVEKPFLDSSGNVVKDLNKKNINNYGIRYYAEKQFQSRVHWLAAQDVAMAKRSIDRLIELTKEVREVAKWQEENLDRIINVEPIEKISEVELVKYLGFNYIFYMRGYLKRHGVDPIGTDKSDKVQYSPSRYGYPKFYSFKEVEKCLLKKRKSFVLLKEGSKIILKTSQALTIRFDGAFRFKREANIFKVYPGVVKLEEINTALGNKNDRESIFERRNLTEADGSKIKFTSHQPRHWRNTIYELAGMSNVQQALAMGRQDLNQNKAYQHTSIKQKLKLHQEFLSFNSVTDKVTFLRDGIRNKTILGEITNTYHYLKKEEGLNTAEDFITTHGLALHLTPFGGCTHDFSQSPCQKHLQCWNGCSHLHRTNTPGETERIKEQLDKSRIILEKIKNESDEDIGKGVWQKDIEKKIKNMEKALKMNPTSTSFKLFPDGPEMTKPLNKRKNKSI